MSILKIIEQLGATNSRIIKESILTKEKDNQLLKDTLKAALDPFVNYYIKQIPDYKPTAEKINLADSLKLLDLLSQRVYTGNAGIEHLRSILAKTTEPTVIKMVIERDLRCGVSDATVNKIWPGLIPTFDVCLAHKDIGHIVYPAFAQTKMDGARCHLVWDGIETKLFSRNGKQFQVGNVFDKTAKLLMRSGEVWDGELLFYEAGKPLDRKTSNGIANKAVKGTLSEEEAAMAVFVCWDIVHSPVWD